MRTFKPTHITKQGKRAESKKYYVEVKDHLGILRKYPGFPEKRLTLALGGHIELLAACKRAGQPPDAQLCEWLQAIPNSLRMRLAKIGLIDRNRAAAGKPLDEHLDDYRQSIGDTTKHARATYNALLKTFRDCKFVYWHDISASVLYNHLARLKGAGEISQRTFNAYLKAAKAFARWMVRDRRASESVIEYLKPVTITKRQVNRRALEYAELIRLLDTTERGPVRFGMTGHERYLVYRLAVETGFRGNEIRSLKVGSFDFKNFTVTVEAGYSKRKRRDILPLKRNSDLPAQLEQFFTNKTPNTRAFGGTYKQLTGRTAEMLKQDLKASKIPYIDEAGRVFDFHSLRHETGTLLAASGVHPKVAQSVMRHSDIALTMQVYSHTLIGSEAAAVAKLPDLSLHKEQQNEKTG